MSPNAADPLSREDALSLGGCLLQGVLSEHVMAMCDTQARCGIPVGTHSTEHLWLLTKGVCYLLHLHRVDQNSESKYHTYNSLWPTEILYFLAQGPSPNFNICSWASRKKMQPNHNHHQPIPGDQPYYPTRGC